jgi:hypothetical protein
MIFKVDFNIIKIIEWNLLIKKRGETFNKIFVAWLCNYTIIPSLPSIVVRCMAYY